MRAEGARADAERREDLAGRALDLLRERVEQVLDADRLRLVARGLALGAAEQIEEARAHVGDAAARLGQALERGLGELQHLVRIGAGAAEDLGDAAIALEQAHAGGGAASTSACWRSSAICCAPATSCLASVV